MIRMLILLCASISVASTAVQGEPLIVQPYLQHPTPSSIIVGFETATNTNGTVEWGPTQALGSFASTAAKQSTAGTYIYHATLKGLQPDTRYWYRVLIDGSPTATWPFMSASAPTSESPTTFVAISDAQMGDDKTKLTEIIEDGIIAFMYQDSGGQDLDVSTDFMIIPGDLVSTGSNHTHWTDHFFAQAAPLLRHVALLPALGNHEANADLYFEYFELPSESGTENWYVTDFSNVRVLTLDSNIAGDAQLQWVDEQLANAAMQSHLDFVVAQLHHPHESEQWLPGESTFTTAVVRRLETWSTQTGKPSIHVFGHTHGYSRGQRRDHRHLMVNASTAMGSLDYWDFYPNNDYEDFTVSRVDYGFCVFNTEAGDNPHLRLRRISRGNPYIPRDNELVDTITIRKFNDSPQTPTGMKPSLRDAPSIGWAVQLEASAFEDPDGDGPLASHWQISTKADDWSAPVINELKNRENWYRPRNGEFWYSENYVTDPTISRVDLRQAAPGCSTLYWRVRYRDDGLQWSAWSEPMTFRTGASDFGNQGPTPADGQSSVSRQPELHWSQCDGADSWDVYLGFDPMLTEVDLMAETFASYLTTAPLPEHTTMYWRADAHRQGKVIPGKVWSFTTGRSFPTPWTSEWRFNQPCAADTAMLPPARGTTPLYPTGIRHGTDWMCLNTSSDTSIPPIDHAPTSCVVSRGIYGQDCGFRTWWKAPGHGGDVNRWTLIMDLYVEPGQTGRVPLIQGNDRNANAAEVSLDVDSLGFHVHGTGLVGPSTWKPGEWFRLAVRCDYSTREAAVHVNGVEVVSADTVRAPDWMWGGPSGKSIWFLTDDGPASETGPIACSAIALVDDMMSADDVAALGRPDARGIFVRDKEACPGDLDGNGRVEVGDVLEALSSYHTMYGPPDLRTVLESLGHGCESLNTHAHHDGAST